MLIVVLAVSVAACGGGSDPKKAGSDSPSARLSTAGPTHALTQVAVPCKNFAGVAQRIAEAESKLYSGAASAGSLSTLLAELNTLKNGAPSGVQAALDDLSAAFRTAQSEIAAPTQAGTARLKALAPKLAADGQKISTYIVSKCTS